MSYWIAKREAISARTDEDAAMAYERFGDRHATRAEARTALIRGLGREVEAFNRLGIASGVTSALEAMIFLSTREAANEVEVGAIRWAIREVKP